MQVGAGAFKSLLEGDALEFGVKRFPVRAGNEPERAVAPIEGLQIDAELQAAPILLRGVRVPVGAVAGERVGCRE